MSAYRRRAVPENQLFADALMLAAADVVTSPRELFGDHVFEIVRGHISKCIKSIYEAKRSARGGR